VQTPQHIGYLGPNGSFSHLAASRQFGADAKYKPYEDIHDVFDAVVAKQIALGLVPIENSAIGGISETLDSFIDSPVTIVAEVLINIHHNLLANAPLTQIQKVYSKPEVFSQCRRWLRDHAHQVQRIDAPSSSKAAQIAADEPHAAAVGSTLAAQIYKLTVQQANIEDNPNNTTRFYVIGAQAPKPSGDDKTAIMFTTEHKPGALAAVLDVWRDYGLDLTHIDKRPIQRVNWEYCFFIDLLGHRSDSTVTQAIEAARKCCLQLKVLGSFPRADQVLESTPDHTPDQVQAPNVGIRH